MCKTYSNIISLPFVDVATANAAYCSTVATFHSIVLVLVIKMLIMTIARHSV